MQYATTHSPTEIQSALLELHRQFQHDTVAAWWEMAPDGTERILFRIHDRDGGSIPNVWGRGKTVAQALENCVKDAGERDPKKMRLEQIDRLRKQIADLEAQATTQPETTL